MSSGVYGCFSHVPARWLLAAWFSSSWLLLLLLYCRSSAQQTIARPPGGHGEHCFGCWVHSPGNADDPVPYARYGDHGSAGGCWAHWARWAKFEGGTLISESMISKESSAHDGGVLFTVITMSVLFKEAKHKMLCCIEVGKRARRSHRFPSLPCIQLLMTV